MTKTILLVDDDKNILEVFKEGLEDLSFEVIAVESAELAQKALSEKKVDCVVTDIIMPGMSGVHLAQFLREKDETMPLFFITAYMDYSREDLNVFRPKAVIFKPFDVEEAALLIKNHFLRNF